MTKFWQSKLFSFNILMVMKTKSIICALAAMLVALGCNKTQDPAYEGTNYIYLSGNSTMNEAQTEALAIDVTLTTAPSADLTLDFEIEGIEGVLSLQGTPLTIKAGEKTAQFSVVSNKAGILKETSVFKIQLAADSKLPEGVSFKEAFTITVEPGSTSSLTEEQKAIIVAYKEKTGIDLNKYIGLLNVSTVITGTDQDSGEPLAPVTVTGVTEITLGESSTADAPVLKMVSNPMGVQDKMYSVLRAVTVEDTEYWANEELEYNWAFMQTISWNADSDETFSMYLDNIAFDADGKISFVGTGLNPYGDEIAIVPFSYSFSAYDRELAAIENKTWKPTEEGAEATANPAFHVNIDDIAEDAWEGGNWIKPAASISEDGSLVFQFCIYMCDQDSDYTRIEASYSPIN